MKLGHDPLHIPEVQRYIDTIFPRITTEKLRSVTNEHHDATWRNWLCASSYNNIVGLDQFEYSSFVPGTTDAFGEFIARYPDSRVRVSRSDFILTPILCRQWNRTIVDLEDDKLREGDILIMSFPFSGNGSTYPDQENVLDQADSLSVPVFVDGAYFGISQDVEYDLTHPCITDFSVSLSKCLTGNPLRVGIRFTKDNIDDGVTAGMIGSDVWDRLGAYIGIDLLRQYSHDWVVETIKPISDQVCKELDLIPTNTMTLATSDIEIKEFLRGDYTRVCITEEIARNLI
jgi:hypothetical protein